jgi:ABC-2 type transport system ATP-binding protein
MLVVDVRNLWVRYGNLVAVRGINLTIPRGEVFGFIGPNGAGKSSTIKVLATLLRDFVGRVRVNGLDVLTKPHQVRERIGYVPDFFGVYEDLTVEEYLQFFSAAYRIDRSRRKSIIGDVLDLTDLRHKLDAPVDGLSRKEMGKTILISSHILHELAQLCTRIGIIEAGKLVAEGSVNDIYRKLGLLRIVHVQAADPLEPLAEKLRQVRGVESAEVQLDRLAIRLHEDQTSIEELHGFLVQFGARLRMFQPEAMDMETAFMKLTEGKTA